jgi:hypothetical protein
LPPVAVGRQVKLVVTEDESEALKSFPHGRAKDGPFAAALARTELIRAVAPNGPQAIADARNVLSGLDTVVLTRSCSPTPARCNRCACAASTPCTSPPPGELAMNCARLSPVTPECSRPQPISEWSLTPGLEIERDQLRGNVIAHNRFAGHSQTLAAATAVDVIQTVVG